MAYILVKVTRKDIEAGAPCRAGSCPIALAVHRHPGFEQAEVGTMDVGFEFDRLVSMELPAVAQKFVEDFDEGRPVKPFAFELPIPDDFYL